jgi:hypothetical protein
MIDDQETELRDIQVRSSRFIRSEDIQSQPGRAWAWSREERSCRSVSMETSFRRTVIRIQTMLREASAYFFMIDIGSPLEVRPDFLQVAVPVSEAKSLIFACSLECSELETYRKIKYEMRQQHDGKSAFLQVGDDGKRSERVEITGSLPLCIITSHSPLLVGGIPLHITLFPTAIKTKLKHT